VSVLLRIAVRNLLEHKGKTLIIGVIIAVAVIVIVVGNAMMDTARRGIERAFIDNYTGDIMISGIAEGDISLFGVQSVGGIEETPVIPEYRRIWEFLETVPEITSMTPQISTFGLLRVENDRIEGIENTVFTVLFGIDPSSYRRMFDNMKLIDGSYLAPGREGVMLNQSRVEELEEAAIEALRRAGVDFGDEEPEFPIRVGDEIRIVSGLSEGLPRIRTLPLVGIYEMTGISEGVGAELVTYVDAQTLRAIQGLSLGTGKGIVLDEEHTEWLDRFAGTEENTLVEDDLFDNSIMDGSLVVQSENRDIDFESLDDLLGTLSDDTADQSEATKSAGISVDRASGEPAERSEATWQYILARVAVARNTDKVVADLNEWFDSEAISVQAGNWEAAAGPFATTADVIRTVFNIAIIIVGVVAVIIIINAMVISILERTSEIGTMRALGAQKGFIWRMFMYETLVITTLFGVVGALSALIIIGILHLIGIPATNTFLRILFAGPELKPVASALSVLVSLLIVSGVGLLAHLYPVSVALKIQPIKAMRTE
jgi:putative ABC transport system permease protein